MAADDRVRETLAARGLPMLEPGEGVRFVRDELARCAEPVVALSADPLALAVLAVVLLWDDLFSGPQPTTSKTADTAATATSSGSRFDG